MSGPFGAGALQYFSGAKGFYPHEIDQSVRFNDDDSAYLSRTPSSAGNRKTFTWSGWVKRGNMNTDQYIFEQYQDANNRQILYFNNSNNQQLNVFSRVGGTNYQVETSRLFRDSSAWYHLFVAADTTQSTAADRVKIYVNGSLVTDLNATSYPPQDSTLAINGTGEFRIGASSSGSSHFDGYMADVHFVDGTALTPTSFGETKEGIWIPKAYTGSYGTNGFKLAFQDSSALGDDTSGNGNDFTANNLAATDQVLDSPTNNFMTFNPLNRSGSSVSFAEGNLRFNSGGSSSAPFNYAVAGNFSGSQATGGKYYWEWYCLDAGIPAVGIFDNSVAWNGGSKIGSDGPVVYYAFDGKFANQGSRGTYGDTFTDGDVIGCAVDFDNRKIWFSKNGTFQNSGDPAAGTGEAGTFADEEYFLGYLEAGSSVDLTNIILNAGQDSTFAGAISAGGNSDANGIGDFKYAPPSGYLALCTANLPDPGIDPNTGDDPAEYFDTLTWSKQGADDSSITLTGLGFQPDFVWEKGRTDATSHQLYDVVRGTGKGLSSDNSDAEVSNNANGYISAFTSDGFTAVSGSANNFYFNYRDGKNYVAWNWKAGGTAVNNTQGSIASSVSASTEAGFSIVSYTGSGTNGATVGHGLSSKPELFIIKNRDASTNWIVYVEALGATKNLVLEDTDAAVTSATRFNNTEPTSSVFSLGTTIAVNGSSTDYIAYCFHSVDGYSQIGSYTGNGNADGPFVYTGFRPAFVIIKRTESAARWNIYDSVRDTNNDGDWQVLDASDSVGESTLSGSDDLDFLSNGFKPRRSATNFNASSGSYIYLAFAEQPFKYSNAR